MHRASIEKLGAEWIKPGKLVSNGAYTLAEFVPNDHIKLVKNPKFYDAANVQIDVVNYIPTEDRSTALKRYEAGELDSTTTCRPSSSPTSRGQVQGPGAGRPVARHLLLCLQDRQGAVVQRPKLRHAISMAIDRDFLAEKVWRTA